MWFSLLPAITDVVFAGLKIVTLLIFQTQRTTEQGKQNQILICHPKSLMQYRKGTNFRSVKFSRLGGNGVKA